MSEAMDENRSLIDETLHEAGSAAVEPARQDMSPVDEAQRPRIKLDPDNVEKGLAQLVLTLVELLRQLLERQAIRRMEAGELTDAQVEKMGDTFLALDQKMDELLDFFQLDKDDLNLNLGPLGDLM